MKNEHGERGLTSARGTGRRRTSRGVAAVALAMLGCVSVGCARQQGGTASLRVIPPSGGTITVTEPTSGGQQVCDARCTLTFARGSTVEVELRLRRPGNPTTTRRFRLTTDLRVRGRWQDRSEDRETGVVVLVGGLVVSGLLIGGGAVALSSSSSGSLSDRFGSSLGAGLLLFLGGAAGVAGLVVGTILIAMNDRPILSGERMPPRIAFWASPVAEGAMLGVVGEL